MTGTVFDPKLVELLKVRHFADRLGVKPCDPDKAVGSILIYAGANGPVYDLVEMLDVLLDRVEAKR